MKTKYILDINMDCKYTVSYNHTPKGWIQCRAYDHNLNVWLFNETNNN